MFAHVDPFAPRRWGRLIAMEWLYAMPEQLLGGETKRMT
jgi:hypothetical protein